MSEQRRKDRVWIDTRRETLQGKLREWDKGFDREARELKGRLSNSGHDPDRGSSDEEGPEDGMGGRYGGGPRPKFLHGKEWKSALRGGGDYRSSHQHKEVGFSIGSSRS
mmetsp:Transcript_20648/g.33483  ORF Transcript_20648/g.33483 Transcript_20648/m.33483 type:complete len:109 (-) Transcript_20648:208-534(-)